MGEQLFDWPDDNPSLRKRFEEFHADNPHVYRKFCEMADRLIARGFRRYSARTIWHAMRFHTDVSTTDPDFKLNNNHTPYYARLWMAEHPEPPDFFSLRRVSDE